MAQPGTYDSRLEPPPHVFTWEDACTSVGIWDSAHAEINGGFLGSVTVRDRATATISAGNLSSLEAREDAFVRVLGVEADRIASRDRAHIDLYGGRQSSFGQVLAGGTGAIRIHGGHYGWALPWPGLGGRIEVYGGGVSTLSSVAQGEAIMLGGEADRLDTGEGGLAVLDGGTVRMSMAADGDEATLVIAGGYPAGDVRLFRGARLIVLHSGGTESDHVVYRLADFDEPGPTADFAGKEVSVSLDGGYKHFAVSAWSNTNQLGDKVWRGRLELMRVRDELKAFELPGGRMLIGFLAPFDRVLRWEVSRDLVSWEPWKAAFPGDGAVHVEVINTAKEGRLFLRMRRWPKPG